jgi:HEAT repeat protein
LDDADACARAYVDMTDEEVLQLGHYLLNTVRRADPYQLEKILSMLATDENSGVRSLVARNPITPTAILQQFADEDENEGVRKFAAESLAYTGQQYYDDL